MSPVVNISPIKWSIFRLTNTLIVSMISLIGIVVMAVNVQTLNRVVFVLVSLAAGALFGDAVIHLLPEAFARAEDSLATSLYVLTGIFTFFVLEKLLRWRHTHVVESDNPGHLQHVGHMNLIADGLHNVIDGMLISASYLVSLPVGIATTVAVLLHEVPQEIGDFGVLLHAGFGKARALMFNFLSASLSIVGALIVLILGTDVEQLAVVMAPLTAGAFLYIAGSDLVPELHKEQNPAKSFVQLTAMSLGVGLMLILLLLE